MPKKKTQKSRRKVVRAKPKHRQLQLPAVMTGPQVQALLGKKRKDKRPVSHVTIVNLVAAGKLKRIGRAKQQGGGWLYDSEQVKKFARSYNPQDGAVVISAKLVITKGLVSAARQRTGKFIGRKKQRGASRRFLGAVDEDALSWLTSVPADDVNFKGRLKSANIATVKAALATSAVKKTVTKRKVLASRLRKLLSLQAS